MTYTKGRIVNDADSHTMETQDWLAAHLEGEYKEMYSQVYSKREGGDRIVKMIDAAKARKSDPEARAKALENPIEGAKGWLGYGGRNASKRSTGSASRASWSFPPSGWARSPGPRATTSAMPRPPRSTRRSRSSAMPIRAWIASPSLRSTIPSVALPRRSAR